jgi:hypothetical protein
LARMEETLENGKDNYSPHLLTRLHYRMEICHKILQDLRDFLASLSPELVPTWEKLVSLLRSTAALNTRSKVGVTSGVPVCFVDFLQFVQKDLDELRAPLLEIKGTMKDGKLPSADGEIYSGQELVVPLLERCLKWCDIVEEK